MGIFWSKKKFSFVFIRYGHSLNIKCIMSFLYEFLFLGGWTPHMKGVGMLVVSLRGVNFGFWSHLGCSGQNAIIFGREGLV